MRIKNGKITKIRCTANCGVLATLNFKRMRIFVTMATFNSP